jgi:hypothetical protein
MSSELISRQTTLSSSHNVLTFEHKWTLCVQFNIILIQIYVYTTVYSIITSALPLDVSVFCAAIIIITWSINFVTESVLSVDLTSRHFSLSVLLLTTSL